MDDRVVTYAQNREDVLIAAFFPEDYKGFYVDIGAHHPVYDSVTKYFYERGWRGINVEPNKRLFGLMDGDRPEDTNLNIGVSSKPGKLKLRIYDDGDGLSTFSSEIKEGYAKGASAVTEKFHDEEVEVQTMAAIFSKQKITEIDFLKIDIEGYEYEAIAGNDWEEYRPKVICIEANHIVKDWAPLLEKANYTEQFYDGLNRYFVAKEATDCIERFSYVSSIIGRPIISLKWNQELLHQVSLRKRLEIEVMSLEARKNEADRQVAHLQAELEHQKRIRVIIKTLLFKIDFIIQSRIERLNKPKRKQASKLVPIEHDLLNASEGSRKELLRLVQKNDLESFYSTGSKSRAYKKPGMYKIFSTIYFTCRSVAKLILKSLLRIAKRVKRLL